MVGYIYLFCLIVNIVFVFYLTKTSSGGRKPTKIERLKLALMCIALGSARIVALFFEFKGLGVFLASLWFLCAFLQIGGYCTAKREEEKLLETKSIEARRNKARETIGTVSMILTNKDVCSQLSSECAEKLKRLEEQDLDSVVFTEPLSELLEVTFKLCTAYSETGCNDEEEREAYNKGIKSFEFTILGLHLEKCNSEIETMANQIEDLSVRI